MKEIKMLLKGPVIEEEEDEPNENLESTEAIIKKP